MSFDTANIKWNDPVGEGGFGIVLPYTDSKNGPKGDKWVIKYAEAFDPKKIMMMLQEIVVGSKCNHPNILRLQSCFIDVDERGKWHIYLKLPRMKTSLDHYQKEREKNNNPFKQDEIIKFFFGIVSGLEQLHLQKIAHRDIKPANVLLDNEGNVKLADFGVVVDIDGKTSMLISSAAGSRTFMAPEVETQMQLKHKVLLKADMWSIGVTIAKLCLGPKFKSIEKGEFPFAQKEPVLHKLLSELEGTYDRKLLNLIKQMIAENPDERPTVKYVREHLQYEFAELLGVEKIEPSKEEAGQEEEKKKEETKRPQSTHEEKLENNQQAKQIIRSMPGKQEELPKIEERPPEETGAIKHPIRPKTEQKEQKEQTVEPQISLVVTDKQIVETVPPERPVRTQSEKKDSQTKEIVEGNKVEKPKQYEYFTKAQPEKNDSQSEERKSEDPEVSKVNIPKRVAKNDKTEQAEVEELKEMKKYLDGQLKKEFTFKVAKNPVRFIIESKNPEEITNTVLTTLLTQLKGYTGKEGKTFESLRGISVTLTYCNDDLNRAIHQLVSDICSHCKDLTYLVLSFWGSHNNIDNSKLKHISAEISQRLPDLEYLGLFFDECTKITGEGVKHLSDKLIPNLSKLKALKLNFNACNQINNESIKLLCSKIAENLPDLEALNLYLQDCTDVQDDTVAVIGTQWASLKSLNSLVLSFTNCTKISHNAIVKLSKNIESLKNLKSLELAFCQLNVPTEIQKSIKAAIRWIPEHDLRLDF